MTAQPSNETSLYRVTMRTKPGDYKQHEVYVDIACEPHEETNLFHLAVAELSRHPFAHLNADVWTMIAFERIH